MTKSNVIATLALVLSCSTLFAAPVTHNHGNRTHSHNLPGTGMAHNHGSLPPASLAKNKKIVKRVNNTHININALASPARIDMDYHRIIAMGTPRNRVAMIDQLSQLQGVFVVRALIEKHRNEGGVIGVKRHKVQSKSTINTACKDYAKKLQARADKVKNKKMQLYKYSTERCVAKAFKMLSFSGASTANDSRPANTIEGKIEGKIKDKLKSTFGKFF